LGSVPRVGEPAYTLYTSVNEFLSVDVGGDANVLYISSENDGIVQRALRHYKACKESRPHTTSAVFCVPRHKVSDLWFQGMYKASISELSPELRQILHCDSSSVVFLDDPTYASGVYARSSLPDSLPRLNHSGTLGEGPPLTFVFDAKIAGANSTLLADSGAKLCFISKRFVQRHGLHVDSCTIPIELADGQFVNATGLVKGKLDMHEYNREMSLYVIDMTPGFHIILGDTWCKQEGVLADFGVDEPSAYIPPSLWLRHKLMRLFPQTSSGPIAARPQQKPLMSAMQTAKWLGEDHTDCGPAFLLMLRPPQEDVEPTSSGQHTQTLLDKYSHLYDPPEVSAFQGYSCDCIRLQPDAAPPNRPPFRLSLSERRELESQVKELLESGRIVPSMVHLYCLLPSLMARCACALIIVPSTNSQSETSTRCHVMIRWTT
jgi:hypothetical protein